MSPHDVPVGEHLATSPASKGPQAHVRRSLMHLQVGEGSETLTAASTWTQVNSLAMHATVMVSQSCFAPVRFTALRTDVRLRMVMPPMNHKVPETDEPLVALLACVFLVPL